MARLNQWWYYTWYYSTRAQMCLWSGNALKENSEIQCSHQTKYCIFRICNPKQRKGQQDVDSSKTNPGEIPNNTQNCELEFLDSHPRMDFCKLVTLKNWVIPMVFYNGARLCSSYNLHINKDEYNESTHEWQEDYTKIAHLMFYPYQTVNGIQLSCRHWKLFNREPQLFKNDQETIMRKKGFKILQNI
jgi:hypothetical protein